MKMLLAVLLAGCATTSTLPSVRFKNAGPVTDVADQFDVPVRPATRTYAHELAVIDGNLYFPARRASLLDQPLRAQGVNSLDEVPSSTWFTNRIGVRTVKPEELAATPGGVGNPEKHLPWTIKSTKVGGNSVGFIVKDSRGEKFIVKFDEPGFPEAGTGAHLVSGRLLWACGYNVTDDYISYVTRNDFVLAPDAVSEDKKGNKHPLRADELDKLLAKVNREKNGTYRTMASRFIDGIPIGGHSPEGTRADDKNDVIVHERRRDLRGARAIFEWLDHDDVQQGQFLDTWVSDTKDPKRHYVKHYMVDYGSSLGVMALVTFNPRRSYEYYVDPEGAVTSLFTLGFHDRVWTRRTLPGIRGVGMFETDSFSPAKWKQLGLGYTPFVKADRFDHYWGTKLVMRFTRPQIRAAVEQGRYSDPRAVDFLVDALVKRQRILGAYWLSRVSSLENLAVEYSDTVCFDDLLLTYGFTQRQGTSYVLSSYDKNEQPLSQVTVDAAATGRTCGRFRLSPAEDGYTIVRIDTKRGGKTLTQYVHLARVPGKSTPRVVGVWHI